MNKTGKNEWTEEKKITKKIMNRVEKKWSNRVEGNKKNNEQKRKKWRNSMEKYCEQNRK